MYNVSEQYMKSMASSLREIPDFQFDLYNLDCDANSSLIITPSGNPLQSGENLSAIIKAEQLPRATFERDYMLANGQYTTEATDCYISGILSSDVVDADGLYPYSEMESLIVSVVSYSSKPLSFVLDKRIAVVGVSINDQEEYYYAFPASSQHHILEVPCDSGEISLRFVASFYPSQRARVYGVHAAEIRRWDCEEIVSIGFEDENDLSCLELPARTLRVRINNLDHKYDVQTEITSPSFSKNNTQATLSFLYSGEKVPLGKFFLKTYHAYREYIQFEFDWAIQPLGEAQHLLSRIGKYYAWERIAEILDPDPELVLEVLRDTVETHPTRLYNLTYDISGVTSISTQINNPFPVESKAVCLQLICNAAGISLRPGRENHDIVFFSKQTEPQRRISYSELLAEPEFYDVGEVATAEVTLCDLSPAANEKISESISVGTEKVYFKLKKPAQTSAAWINSIKDAAGNEVGLICFAAQGYALFVWVEMLDGSSYSAETGAISINVHNVVETTLVKANGSYDAFLRGEHGKRLSNVLVDSSIHSVWWRNLEQWLNQNARAKIKHRGFPELDCGDIIEVQLSPEGDYQKAYVVKNTFDFSEGYLSGSTELIVYKRVVYG